MCIFNNNNNNKLYLTTTISKLYEKINPAVILKKYETPCNAYKKKNKTKQIIKQKL